MNKIGILTGNLTLFLCSVAVSTPSFSLELSTIKNTYKERQYKKTIDMGKKHLKTSPKDADVRLYVALSYYQLKNYAAAAKNYRLILNDYPKYKDARLGLQRAHKAQQYQTSEHASLPKYNHTNLTGFPGSYRPHRPGLAQTDSGSIRDIPHWELTGTSLNAKVHNPDSIWDWSSVFLYRKNEYGSFGGAVNYANRQGRRDPQGWLNLQPKINNKWWLDLTYAYANNPYLFPNQTVRGEVYTLLFPNVEVSIGDDYRKIEHTYFTTATGSLGLYLKNYYLTFRPNHYTPKHGPRSTLYTVTARRYSKDNPDQYIGVTLAGGTSPDLFDLLTVDFIKVKEQIYFINGQQPISDTLLFLYGVGYEHQIFPNDLRRTLAYLNLGLVLRFN